MKIEKQNADSVHIFEKCAGRCRPNRSIVSASSSVWAFGPWPSLLVPFSWAEILAFSATSVRWLVLCSGVSGSMAVHKGLARMVWCWKRWCTITNSFLAHLSIYNLRHGEILHKSTASPSSILIGKVLGEFQLLLNLHHSHVVFFFRREHWLLEEALLHRAND